MVTASRYHDISCGHRVVNHESKCKHLHGHNYRIHFVVEAPELDDIGRVLDFSVIKEKLCMWVENNYDHKTLLWKGDPYLGMLPRSILEDIIVVDYNPTAENMAKYLVEVIGPKQLEGTSCNLIQVTIEETRKCQATYALKR